MPRGIYPHTSKTGFQIGNENWKKVDIKKRGETLKKRWANNDKRKLKAKESFIGKNNPNWGKEMREEKAPNWGGDKVGYHGVHKWVTRWRGKPKLCEACGSIDKKKYEWANIDHSYKRVLDDYIRLCTACHRKYDYEKNQKDKS